MKKVWLGDKPGWTAETEEERIKREHEMQFGPFCEICGYGISFCICNDEVVQAYFKKEKEFKEELRKIWIGEK